MQTDDLEVKVLRFEKDYERRLGYVLSSGNGGASIKLTPNPLF